MSAKEVTINVKISVEDEALQQAIRDATNDAIGGAIGTEEVGAQLGIEAMLRGGVGQLGTGPMGIMRQLIPFLGPAAAALLAPIVFEFVIKELTRPGGPWDTRFRREIEKEYLGMYDRQIQHDTRYGYRNVIIQGQNGFQTYQGEFHASTYRDIAQGFGESIGKSRIGITDKALGVRDY